MNLYRRACEIANEPLAVLPAFALLGLVPVCAIVMIAALIERAPL